MMERKQEKNALHSYDIMRTQLLYKLWALKHKEILPITEIAKDEISGVPPIYVFAADAQLHGLNVFSNSYIN